MAAATAASIPFPPTFRFRPTKRELIEFYLLPNARGQDPFPGVLIEDDAAGSSLPWDLFERHGLGSEDEAYFLVRTRDAKKPGGRQDRGCDGGVGSWRMQSSLEKALRVGGEKITCRKSNLNLHMGKGKSGGSVGWVMHEYTIAAPPCPSPVKICHIAFTGHGKNRKRVPDYQQVFQTGNASAEQDSNSSPLVLAEDNIFSQSPLLGIGANDSLGFPSAASADASQYQEELEKQVPSTEVQQQVMMLPQLTVRQSSMGEQFFPGELEFWSSIGIDIQSNNWSSIGVGSNCVVPGIGDMAGDQRQQDFWSLGGADVQSNCCAVPDMAAGALGGGAHWGGCYITC